jgi:N-hydroxyarylamine O-acetyltransferase
MTRSVDLDAYFARIGYRGPCTSSLETLSELHLRHPQAIPFENLNPLLRWPVLLDADALQRKLVRGGRGGYCYEHNLLFADVLRALGFRVRGLAARVQWNVPDPSVMPRSHMLLLVEFGGGTFIADVGFGGLTLTSPLRLEMDVEQRTPHEVFRLLAAGDGFVLQARIGATWKPLYRFDLQEQSLADYEVTNWYLCHHPASRFVAGLMAARAAADRRYALRDNELTVHHLSGETERQLLTSADALRRTLQTTFGLTLPEGPELEAALSPLLRERIGP